MLSRFGIETSQLVQYLIAFGIILVLLILFWIVVRRLTGGRLLLPGQDRARARQPRLGIVDIYDLDRQRQLILLRRDNVEHLLLIGGPNDVVVETNIVRVPGARLPTPAATETVVERAEPSFEAPREASRPAVEASGRPSLDAPAARLGGVTPPRPPETSDAAEELAPVASASAPIPGRVEPALKPDVVAPVAAPPTIRPLRGDPGPTRSTPVPPAPPEVPSRPVPPPPSVFREPPRPAPVVAEPPAFRDPPRSPPVTAEPPRPAPADPRPPVTPPTPEIRPSPPRPVQTVTAPPTGRPSPAPVSPAPEGRTGDAAVLSDMARQLEEALKRPAAPVPPPGPEPRRLSPEAPASRSATPEALAEDADGLLVPGPGARAGNPGPGTAPPGGPAPSAPHRPQEPLRPLTEPPRPATEPVRPAPPPPPAASVPPPPSAPPANAPASSPTPPRPPADDPFSVEDIEAEFARLLGRPSGGDRT